MPMQEYQQKSKEEIITIETDKAIIKIPLNSYYLPGKKPSIDQNRKIKGLVKKLLPPEFRK